MTQGIAVVGVLVAGDDRQHPEPNDLGQGVIDLGRVARVFQPARQSARRRRSSTSRNSSRPPSEDSTPPSKRISSGFERTGDKPGRESVVSTMAGGRRIPVGFVFGDRILLESKQLRYTRRPPRIIRA